jgi:hypothetical protein
MRVAWLLLLAALAGPLQADEGEEAALALADESQAAPAARRPCLEYGEAAAIQTTYADEAPSSSGRRASFAIRCDGAFSREWRAVFSDRFDYSWSQGASAQAINTLKEAYVSYRDGGTEIFDLGVINVRRGVALAYNPTDYFRADAIRALISIDPETLRDERMGTLMARSQTLWSSGSLTAIYAPRVEAQPTAGTFSPDFGATNGQSRWLLVLSQRLAQDFQPQLSLTATEHQSPQAALNLTWLLNRATIAYVEWSGGRSAGNVALSGYGPPASAETAFRSRLGTGLTYTTSYKLSVSLEYEYDGAAPDGNEWALLRSGPLAPYVQYRQYAARQGEIATRQNWFAYAHWDDVGINHLGLTSFVHFDPYDHSHVTWAEARYHWEHAGLALQWQHETGDAKSNFAPWPARQAWFALVDYYF